jgi:hypothetical protein
MWSSNSNAWGWHFLGKSRLDKSQAQLIGVEPRLRGATVGDAGQRSIKISLTKLTSRVGASPFILMHAALDLLCMTTDARLEPEVRPGPNHQRRSGRTGVHSVEGRDKSKISEVWSGQKGQSHRRKRSPPEAAQWSSPMVIDCRRSRRHKHMSAVDRSVWKSL